MTKIALALTLTLLLSGCYKGVPTGIDGVTVAPVGQGKDHIALLPCEAPKEVAEAARVALPVLIRETIKQGYSPVADVGDLRLCLVSEPSQCCLGGWPCAGPCKRDGAYVSCARKAGCATHGYVWVSRTWPMTCSKEWPDEPHCSTPIADYDWRRTLVHELGNIIRLRYLDNEGYDATSVSRYYQPGGPVDLAQRALQ